MSIRYKILLYFSFVAIVLNGLSFLLVYNRFAQYREEEFQQRQKEKIITTFKYLTQFKHLDEQLITSLDMLNIEDLIDEKLLIFNSSKKLIYSSIDNIPIPFSSELLNALNEKKSWIERKDERYDVVGLFFNHGSDHFYAISKAYDHFGYSKLDYLRNMLGLTFIFISIIIITSSWYLSRRITQSIQTLTESIKEFDLERSFTPVKVEATHDEVQILAERFNELMIRLNEAFAFQKHAIHHISHELKTPIAILVSNFDRMEQEKDTEKLQEMLLEQKEGTRNLSEIINALLEIAKAESGNQQQIEAVRIDELIFDLMSELQKIQADFVFKLNYEDENINDQMLTIQGNKRLLRAVFQNLMLNCLHYSDEPYASILLKNEKNMLSINISNKGPILSEKEQSFLFQHFFRGSNSKGKRGFGLGLVLINKIVALHHGTIHYSNDGHNLNTFMIELPLH